MSKDCCKDETVEMSSTVDSCCGTADAGGDGCSVSQAGVPAGVSREEWLRLARKAKLLSWFSLGYMGLEGLIAVIAGIVAGSVALIGFGIDSFIEGIASLVIVWRFSGARLQSEDSEKKAQRFVAAQFFILAPYIAYESVAALLNSERPDISALGMALTATSLIIMPILGRMKERISKQLGSTALQGEGRQNILCAMLAAAVFIGLLGNALFGAWWLDPVVGLLIAGLAVKEGIETLRGEGCCVPSSPAVATGVERQSR